MSEARTQTGWNVPARYRCAPTVTIVSQSMFPSAALKLQVANASALVLRAYCFSRTALNVPCFEGPSPTVGEKSASPVIKSGLSNFPLSVKFPASRPTLPSRNSTGPENITELPSPGLHFASEGLAPPQALDCGSVTVRVPFPSPCASKRRKRCWSLAKVTSIFQLPVTVGESASATTKENVFTAITRIIARTVFTFFSTGNLVCAQIHWVLRLQFTRNSRGV